MEGRRFSPAYGKVHYGAVPRRTPNIVAISDLQIPFPHHAISRRHPRTHLRNAASVKDQRDDHCGREPSLCVSVCSSGNDMCISFSRSCLVGGGRKE